MWMRLTAFQVMVSLEADRFPFDITSYSATSLAMTDVSRGNEGCLSRLYAC